MKTTKSSKKKFLLGLSVSLVLAMAVGSLALGETQTPANTQFEAQSAAVNAGTGAFNVSGGVEGTDYDYSSGVLSIHPQSSATQITISTNGATTDRIEITAGPQDAEKAVNIILNGVNINRSNVAEADPKAALKIAENATFNVNITLAGNSVNTLNGEAGDIEAKPYVKGSPGIEKSNDSSVDIDQLGKLTIKGTGQLTATGGNNTAGIGGITGRNGSKIAIESGVVIAKGGASGAGIGSGTDGDGTYITISGGDITAIGGAGGAGIGGGSESIGTHITISGGVITAIGGHVVAGESGGLLFDLSGAGIGGGGGSVGAEKGSSDNKLDGDAVVLAVSGGDDLDSSTSEEVEKAALDGFDQASGGSLAKGIAFTGVGVYDPETFELLGINWDKGEQYSSLVEVTENVQFPTDFAIGAGKTLTVGSGATLNIADGTEFTNNGTVVVSNGAKIVNEGTITDKGTLTCAGTITTLLSYDPQGGTIKENAAKEYITYQDSSGTKTYGKLKEATKDGYTLGGWYTKAGGQGAKVNSNTTVYLNEHTLYAHWVTGNKHKITINQPENGKIVLDEDEAFDGDEVGFTLTPNEGYELKEGSVKITDKDGKEITVTEKDGKYTFKMPDSEVTVSAVFEGKSHKISIDQPENGTVKVNPENPRTGDEVTITLTPNKGYQPDGEPVVRDENGKEIKLTPTGNPGEYKFIMPNSNLTLEANFVPSSAPTPDPSVNPDGSGSSKTGDPFMGGIALALLGVATTGAVLVRKRK